MLNTDLFQRFDRKAQIITLKDCGAIVAYTGLSAGDKVVDAGTGSGFLAAFLANIVGPQGKVYTYEIDGHSAKLSQQNFERAGLRNIELRQKSVLEGIEEQNVHLVTLDLPDSEKALLHAFKALVAGGYCVGYLPNTEQLSKFVEEGERVGFRHERSLELIVREWLVRKQGTRPDNTGLLHTAFLAFLRKPFGKL